MLPLLSVVGVGRGAFAQAPPCQPCAGIRVQNPLALEPQLKAVPRLADQARLFVAWDEDLRSAEPSGVAARLEQAGAVPWLRLQFSTPAPIMANLEDLESELERASQLAASVGESAHIQILWRPAGQETDEFDPQDYAYLLKRAAVAVTGAQLGVRVITQPLPAESEALEALYREEVAAYLEGVALRPTTDEALKAAIELLAALDPGKPVIFDAQPYPEVPAKALALAARLAAAGVAITLFDAAGGSSPPSIAPLKVLAQEFQGDLAFDPYSTPSAAAAVGSWAFVRGEDLGLRVIVEHGRDTQEVSVRFSDRNLRNPSRVDPTSGESLDMYGGVRSQTGYELRWEPTEDVTVLRLERPGAEEIEGIQGLEEEVTVVSERLLPVEEILRRLQSVEDAQNRRLETYRATNTTHLRFQFGTEGIQVTFQGELFYRRDQGYDWAWEKFNLNGLRWRGKEFPKVPLIQPERAVNMPLEILFSPDYQYRLRGTAVIEGRDCWVVDFRPLSLGEGESLYRGTVWIDRSLYVRVRSRAVQIGLEGEVLSNEETTFFAPLDEQGQPAEWHPGSLILPQRVVSNQIWSVFNSSLVVEKETLLAEMRFNDPDFESRRQELLASDYTMVRNTEEGLRYLVPDKKTGERVVQEKLSSNRIFFGGGILYEPSLDYPVPLLGVDYFSLDFRGTGSQVNAFFAGPLIQASLSNPHFLGSRFDAGVNVFALGIRGSNTRFRNGDEIPEEEIEQRQANLSLSLGHLLNSFTKINFSYRLLYTDFASSDSTAEEFGVPVDHLTHTLRLGGTFSRSGYRLRLNGSYNKRSDWQPWGLPDTGDYDPKHEDFLRWQASFAKTFYFKKFRIAGIDLLYVDGEDLDRFSKYQLGFFSDVRVRGYESNRIRAERAFSATASYGIDLGGLFRVQLLGDSAWITDQDSGFDQEFAAGVGLAGTVVGPWQTLVRLDLGKAVAGPDDGYGIFLAFLKLWG